MKAVRILLILTFVFAFKYANTQDFIIRNLENQVIHNDSAVDIQNRTLKVDIGPVHKSNNNTIFFKNPFIFKSDTFSTFRIKGVYNHRFEISNSKFLQEELVIDSTDFDTLTIENCEFTAIIFNNVNIKKLKFVKNTVSGSINFNNCAIFDADFSESVFDGQVAFRFGKLGNIDFSSSVFYGQFILSMATLSGVINCFLSKFEHEMALIYLKREPSSALRLIGTSLPTKLSYMFNLSSPDTFDLTYTKINSRTGRKTELEFSQSDLSKIKLNYTNFRLGFQHDVVADEKQSVYERLLRNFKDQGFQDSYRKLDIEYRRFRSKQGTFGFLWWVPELWWQYGYDKGRVFKITFYSLLLFTVLNFFFLNFLVTSVYSIQSIPAFFPRWDFNRLWFAFVYTGVIFFSLGLKVERIKFNNKLGSLYLVILYVYGIVCLAYMANFILQQ